MQPTLRFYLKKLIQIITCKLEVTHTHTHTHFAPIDSLRETAAGYKILYYSNNGDIYKFVKK
jgi:hypothetical protein